MPHSPLRSPLSTAQFPPLSHSHPAVRTTLIRSPVRSLTCYFRFRIRFVCCRRRNLTKSHVSRCRCCRRRRSQRSQHCCCSLSLSLCEQHQLLCSYDALSFSHSARSLTAAACSISIGIMSASSTASASASALASAIALRPRHSLFGIGAASAASATSASQHPLS